MDEYISLLLIMKMDYNGLYIYIIIMDHEYSLIIYIL